MYGRGNTVLVRVYVWEQGRVAELAPMWATNRNGTTLCIASSVPILSCLRTLVTATALVAQMRPTRILVASDAYAKLDRAHCEHVHTQMS